MALRSLLGINYSQKVELLLLLVQLLCYANAYYVTVFLLGPLSFLHILLLTLAYSRPLIALFQANNGHLHANQNSEQSQFCKKCQLWITNRDHHCIFTGRCVQKYNYKYFISYVFYSYALSINTLVNLATYWQIFKHIHLLQYEQSLPLIAAIISSVYFTVFTGGLLASSFRSIVQGIYTVDELKNRRIPKYTDSQLRKMWFSSVGRASILQDFKQNWKKMVGDDVDWTQILLVL